MIEIMTYMASFMFSFSIDVFGAFQVLLPLEGQQLSDALRRALRERRAEPAASLGARLLPSKETFPQRATLLLNK